ncbi:hypothetical protein IU487_32085 [Nocardia puris]|uniref:hypothetical protein n=1 Tax=Nocardia puris TaxID=208602 RepID=UPI001895BDEB|nr:hypothetical protein [Nocardia puris]MBF6215638.1 hypothetical protein [Nocardia puris]
MTTLVATATARTVLMPMTVLTCWGLSRPFREVEEVEPRELRAPGGQRKTRAEARRPAVSSTTADYCCCSTIAVTVTSFQPERGMPPGLSASTVPPRAFRIKKYSL